MAGYSRLVKHPPPPIRGIEAPRGVGLKRGGGEDIGMTDPRNRNGSARRKLRARLRAEGRPCHLCGQPIDYSLPAGHPWSFEVDEIIPVSRGGDPLDYGNVDAAHRLCNQRRGNRMPGDSGAKGLPITRSRLF